MPVDSWPLAAVPPRVIAAWRDLAARALDANPFAEPDFAIAAARCLPDQGDPELLVVSEGGEMVACTPIVRRRRWRRVPWPTVAVWRHDYCFLGTPLVDADRAEAAQAALVRAGAAHGALLALEWMPADGRVLTGLMGAATEQGARPVTYERFARASTDHAAGAPRLTLSGDRRRRLRRLGRKLALHVGGEVHLVDRAGDPAVVERFLALEATGWKGRRGTAMSCRPGHADFMREVCRSYAAAGRLRLHALEADGRILAVICGFRAGDGLFLFKIAHDPALAPYSPGRQLMVAACEASDARWIDSGAAPEETWVNELFPARTTIASVVVPPGGRRGQLLAFGVGSFVAARDARGGRSHR